jgi:hypothetical protein
MSAAQEAIQKKIQEAKEKKAAGKANGGAAANLGVEKDAEGVPLPQATGKKSGGVAKKAVQAGTAATKAPKFLNACGCGCGQPCKSRFLPGHDAKLHGWVKKLAAGVMSLDELPPGVRNGMYPKVKQGVIKGTNEKGEKTETLAGVQPTVTEAAYLDTLKGQGGPAN